MRLSAVVGLLLLVSACEERAKPKRETSPGVEGLVPSEPTVAAPVATTLATTLPPVKVPKGTVAIGRIVSDFPVPEAELVIGIFRDDFAKCYETALDKTPTLVGRAELVVVVEPVGSIVGAPRAEKVQGLPTELTSCLAKQLANVRFKGFSGRRATLHVPIAFALVRPDAGGVR